MMVGLRMQRAMSHVSCVFCHRLCVEKGDRLGAARHILLCSYATDEARTIATALLGEEEAALKMPAAKVDDMTEAIKALDLRSLRVPMKTGVRIHRKDRNL